MKKLAAIALLIISIPVIAIAEITENDLFIMQPEMKKYKKEVIWMLNHLSTNHAACKRIAPNTAAYSKSKSKPGNPSFFVQCGDKSVPEVVRFSLRDIKKKNTPKAAKNIDRQTGIKICEAEARKRAQNPSTVDFSKVADLNVSNKPNGNTVISSSFTAKNKLGNKSKYRIFCYFDGKPSLVEVTIKEAK